MAVVRRSIIHAAEALKNKEKKVKDERLAWDLTQVVQIAWDAGASSSAAEVNEIHHPVCMYCKPIGTQSHLPYKASSELWSVV